VSHTPPHDHPKPIPGPATEGAQKQIDAQQTRLDRGLRAMIVAGVIFILAASIGAWQISAAFHKINDERSARVGALASINTFLCQRIDRVGNGVAALVAVQLRQAPIDETKLTPGQLRALRAFRTYVEEQERPPRCRELALKVATLTGADPRDVVITPIKLQSRPPGSQSSRP
jgi:hypothetical protein